MRPQPGDRYAHPRVLVAEAVAQFGIHSLLDTCLALLEGYEDYDRLPVPLTYIGGEHARSLVDRGEVRDRRQDYWPRTWALRALLYAWEPYVVPRVCGALEDDHWRVREMAAKVIVARGVDDAVDALLGVVDDPTPRVQVAALRACAEIGGEDHLTAVESLEPEDRAVVVARASTIRALRRKLDRVGPGFS